MKFKIIFLEEFGKAFVPKRVIPNLRKYLRKAGVFTVPYKFFGSLFYISTLITALIYVLVLYNYFSVSLNQFSFFIASFFSWLFLQLLFVFLLILIVYFYIDIKIFRRTQEMEDMLPDFLQEVSSNLKSGLTFEASLWTAIKPRFKILADEIAEVSKRVMTGKPVGDALMEFSEKYNSPMLRRAMDLLISELESGGNIANLLDKIIDNLKATKLLKQEMSASAIAYIIFISAIVIFISPLLFSLAFNLLSIVTGLAGQFSGSIGTTAGGASPFSLSSESVNLNHFKIFSVAAVATTAIFSSMIVSIVEKGTVKGGVKYIPIYLFGSVIFYLVFVTLFSKLFGNIF